MRILKDPERIGVEISLYFDNLLSHEITNIIAPSSKFSSAPEPTGFGSKIDWLDDATKC